MMTLDDETLTLLGYGDQEATYEKYVRRQTFYRHTESELVRKRLAQRRAYRSDPKKYIRRAVEYNRSHREQVLARQRKRYRTDPEYRARLAKYDRDRKTRIISEIGKDAYDRARREKRADKLQYTVRDYISMVCVVCGQVVVKSWDGSAYEPRYCSVACRNRRPSSRTTTGRQIIDQMRIDGAL